jgi:peptide-methionine (S)-S-oxide reductase
MVIRKIASPQPRVPMIRALAHTDYGLRITITDYGICHRAKSLYIDSVFNDLMKPFLLLLACFVGWASVSLADMDDTKSSGQTQTIVFGGGCFWCLDAQFKMVDGVRSVLSGYAGGSRKNPTYEEVCTGATGHAEVVQVEFDPAKVSLDNLLKKFFRAHDPTTLNRQGPDEGTQYRSIILYKDDQQKAVAEKAKAEAQKDWPDPIVTEIVPLSAFYKAEEYHQDYFAKNPTQGYCRLVVAPKVKKFEKLLKEEKH